MIPWRSDATKRDVYLGIEKYFNIGIEINTKTKKGLVVYHKKYGLKSAVLFPFCARSSVPNCEDIVIIIL